MSRSKIIQLVFISILLVIASGFTQAYADERNRDRVYTLSDVKGRYAFSFDGEIIGLGPIAATGYIKSDGKAILPKQSAQSPRFLVPQPPRHLPAPMTLQPMEQDHQRAHWTLRAP